jgi:hypothetical protein
MPNKPSADDERYAMRVIDEVNSTPVLEEDMWELMKLSNDYHRDRKPELDDDNFVVAVSLIAEISKGNQKKSQALFYRMQALARLISDEGAPGWTMPKAPDGSMLTKAAVFSAAARHPLVFRDGDFAFDRTSFLDRVLELADPETHA